ncbi:collagen alpha-1(VI) chain-like [Branchiostoma floridae]|uniref:Collagen alpha-1(VI) chain-like n=1 Tax=Branchiostoma floridae TaxID=7739 RepID=A0A9J7LT41_BRAFL|nr:collagen alpha-1(VI) chain-like [Branchiostoma floridae]
MATRRKGTTISDEVRELLRLLDPSAAASYEGAGGDIVGGKGTMKGMYDGDEEGSGDTEVDNDEGTENNDHDTEDTAGETEDTDVDDESTEYTDGNSGVNDEGIVGENGDTDGDAEDTTGEAEDAAGETGDTDGQTEDTTGESKEAAGETEDTDGHTEDTAGGAEEAAGDAVIEGNTENDDAETEEANGYSEIVDGEDTEGADVDTEVADEDTEDIDGEDTEGTDVDTEAIDGEDTGNTDGDTEAIDGEDTENTDGDTEAIDGEDTGNTDGNTEAIDGEDTQDTDWDTNATDGGTEDNGMEGETEETAEETEDMEAKAKDTEGDTKDTEMSSDEPTEKSVRAAKDPADLKKTLAKKNSVRGAGAHGLSVQNLRGGGSSTCEAPVDLFFLLDGSGSVKAANFAKVKQFVVDMVNSFDVSPAATRVGVLQYSNRNTLVFNLGNKVNKPTTVSAINSISYQGGGTRTGAALQYVRGNAAWRRGNVPKALIVLTDGKSEDSVSGPSQSLVSDRVEVYAIGVSNFDHEELLQIVNNKQSNVIELDDFNALATKIDEIAQEVCSYATEEVYANSFEVLRTANQQYRDVDFFVIKARLPADGLSASENWCRDYQRLCAQYGLRPTGCGEQYANSGHYAK